MSAGRGRMKGKAAGRHGGQAKRPIVFKIVVQIMVPLLGATIGAFAVVDAANIAKNNGGPSSNRPSDQSLSTVSPSSSGKARPSPSGTNSYRSEVPSPNPSVSDGGPLRLRRYSVKLDSLYGIPLIQDSNVPPSYGKLGQDLYYTLQGHELRSLDGGSLAPISESSYAACMNAQYGTSVIFPQKVHLFCFKGKETGIFALVGIVPPIPDLNSPSPDTLTLEITISEG
jgi:hypothetical protein